MRVVIMAKNKKIIVNQYIEKILWVENDLMHIQDHANALRDQGSTLLTATNITEAIMTIKENPDINTVILDMMMPISSQEQELYLRYLNAGPEEAGLALGRWIRENFPDIKLFGYSVKIDKKIMKWFEKYGIGFALKQSFLSEDDFIRYFRRKQMEEKQIIDIKTFIVHGHDEKEKLALKNYLQNTLGLPEPIILHERPSMGRTIIEKFEEIAADIDVVFVLLTPDDKAISEPSDKVHLRTRQNVIFELGYFIARMERRSGRVILLYKGDLDLPSNLSGLIYINIDKGVEAAGEEIRRELVSI